MTIPVKRLANGFQLPVYGLGLWQMGGRWDVDTSKDEQEISAIRTAIDGGITHIDTAESYGHGHAEELLRSALADYDRSKLFITTKVSADHQSYDGVHEALVASLKRIGTDYVDLYLLHRYPESGTHIKDTMRAMDELKRQGMIKNIGVCNMTVNRFKEAQNHTSNKLVCNQVHYNVQVREMEYSRVLEFCQANDVMLVAWRPLQKGLLPHAPILDELAAKYRKTPAQVAINWLISQDHVVTLCKTSNLTHLKENLGALDWNLDTTDIERIRREFPNQQAVSSTVPLNYPADVAP